MKDFVKLSEGSGGAEMEMLIKSYGEFFRGNWENSDNDSATLDINDKEKIVFTTDTFVVSPVFFPGGDIGHLAVCGTVNDLCVMGANPLGISIGLVIEEGFSKKDLGRIMDSIKEVSKEYNIPVVTGDTKVMAKGDLDGVIINTSGVGLVMKDDLFDKKLEVGDKVIISGGIGEHAAALLSKRFDFETDIVTDSKPLIREVNDVKGLIKVAKDPTRGGIAAVLNEICLKNDVGMRLLEEDIPAKPEVKKIVDMLGIDIYQLASEGRFVCVCSATKADEVLCGLKKYNSDASIVGEIVDGSGVVLKTFLGERILPVPTGRIVPRIC